MYFQLIKIILWPKGEYSPRELNFIPGAVNVISGASKTGKSAVIPIVDYCLASKSCRIPVGVIREQCEWFGILIDTVEGKKLLARREPGDQQATGEMFVLESQSIEIPQVIVEKNSNSDIVKAMLDRLAGLSTLDFDTSPEPGFKSRPSFRDLTAFMFQPQHIVANPGVLFYKADTTEHREKLKTIFPYVLNAVTPRVLYLRHELDKLYRKLRKLESDIKNLQQVSSRRISEGRTWINQARELGLGSGETAPETWPEILDALRDIAGQDSSGQATTIGGIEDTLQELQRLRQRETQLTAEASTHRQRLMELRRLQEGSYEFAGALRLQREHLSLSTWMRSKLEEGQEINTLVSKPNADSLEQLCDALSELEGQLSSHPLATNTLDTEYLRQRRLTEELLSNLSSLKQEIRSYEANTDLAQEEVRRTATAERFLGGLQQLLLLYAESDTTSALVDQMDVLKQTIIEVEAEIHEHGIQKRLDSVLHEIQQITSSIVPNLNAEWGNSPVRLNPKELTVQVSREGRMDYLWEIGSGANWLAYHVAITLALQSYFLAHPPHPVPGLLIYDQPSQVYFPKLSASSTQGVALALTNQEDIQAVRNVFNTMGEQVVKAKGGIQIIVLDHAHEEVWGNLPGVVLVEEWRDGKKLVPIDWTA